MNKRIYLFFSAFAETNMANFDDLITLLYFFISSVLGVFHISSVLGEFFSYLSFRVYFFISFILGVFFSYLSYLCIFNIFRLKCIFHIFRFVIIFSILPFLGVFFISSIFGVFFHIFRFGLRFHQNSRIEIFDSRKRKKIYISNALNLVFLFKNCFVYICIEY